MRKWMRDRMKRRKKPAEQATTEPGPAPLQPAYFDAAPAGVEATEPEDTAPEVQEQADAQPEAAEPASAEGTKGSTRPRRRRRGRGGRGRGAGKASGAAAAESAGQAETPVEVQQPAISATDADIPAAPPRPSKGVVVLAIGLPGSGKSSWFKRHNITPLSSDMLRALLFDDSTEQRYQDLIFSNLRSMLKARLIARRPMNYVDATNLTPHDRQSWIKLAKDFGYEVQAVFFDVPVEVCLQRNQKRSRVVEEEIMRRMAGKLKAPTFNEGFSKITVVRVKARE